MAAACLFIVDGNGAGKTLPIEGEVVVGRGRDADLVIADLEISRRHFRARVEGATLIVEDLGSSNGTFVNGEPVRGPVRLRERDEIKLGGTTLEFRYETTQLDDATPTEATSVYRPD